ncbi:MAG: hypothetical protein ACTSP9_16010 [Promethearchaeota archaeon]
MKLNNPVNIILLAISFLIFGTLGIIFITQMELVPGYNWDTESNKYPAELDIQLTGDLNDDGNPDIISNSYTRGVQINDMVRYTYNITRHGAIYAIDGLTGLEIWSKEYSTPVRNLFPIGDINSDGYEDFFANMMRVENYWEVNSWNPDELKPIIIHNNFTNIIVSGEDGSSLSGNITTNFVIDVIRISDLGDNIEDFILIEGKYQALPDDKYYVNMSTYFINGTRTKTLFQYDTNDPGLFSDFSSSLREFDYNGQTHALFLGQDAIVLYNTSSDNLLDPIFSKFGLYMDGFCFVEDLNLDGILEILTISWEGNVSLLNGLDGNLIDHFMIPITDTRAELSAMNSTNGDGTAYVLISITLHEEGQYYAYVYSISQTEQDIIWEYYKFTPDEEMPKCFALGEDLTGDNIDEIMLYYTHTPLLSQAVRRITLVDPILNSEIALLNTDYHIDYIISIPDIDTDGKKDYAFSDGSRIIGIATQDPISIWISPLFEPGLIIFIILAIMLVFSLIVLIINGKKIKPKRDRLQQSKMAVVANVVAISLMTISFVMFLLQLNIFNRTLVLGDPMTSITIVYLTTTIIWFGLLPLTAAIYNQFAPAFAYSFIALRSFFFKFSKSYKHAIFVEDLQNRKQLSTTIRLKRVLLPLLLSIAVGFYSYNVLSLLFGYPQSFDTFGGQKFFQFMIGYNLLCILPMVLTFIIFSFFISGNYLLDDAGIAYYLESKKHRRPGDIEPISIWSQSIIKGVAGFSAIITFIAFFQTVDFSGFFTETGDNAIFMFIFGIFLVTVMFYGTPFLTAFSYILFSIEVMDYSHDYNSEKLYKKMQKHGYDTTPRKLTNLFPSGFEELRRIPESKKEEKESN